MYWQTVRSRLSIPGLALLLLGAVVCMLVPRYAKRERVVLAARLGGLALAVVGTLILLDLIPGL